MKLQDKVALVFGGSSGIGEAVSIRLAAEGAKVAVVASSSIDKAEKVASRLSGARAYAADVRSPASIRAVVEAVERDLGPVDVLVNSAGVYYPTPLGETSEDDFDRMVQTHLKGTFFAIDAVAPSMKRRRTGRIVNVASVAGFRGSSRFPVYSMVKAGIVMLTKALAGDLAPHDVHINAIAPGNTATPLNQGERTGDKAPDILAAKAAATPSTRTYSPPEEMAAAVLFLVSGEVNAMHGATILLDEGLSACV